MECSLSGIGKIECGENRGVHQVVNLNKCLDDIQSHLASCHLSRSHLSEDELILARAGLFDLTNEQKANMQVCPSHRNNLGRFWRPLRSCQYPAHSGPVRQCKGRHVFNIQLCQDALKLYGVIIPVGSPICTQCVMKHKEKIDKEYRWVRPVQLQTDQEDSQLSTEGDKDLAKTRFSQDVDDSLMSASSCMETPLQYRSMQHWTPSQWRERVSDSEEEESDTSSVASTPAVTMYNDAMQLLSKAAGVQNPPKLAVQLHSDWDETSKEERNSCIESATEACKLICEIVAPAAGSKLFESLPRQEHDVSDSQLALITAFANAPTRNLKTQILSIYAYTYPIKVLQKLHEPYGKLTQWQIKRARAHARANGPGLAVVKPVVHRISLDMVKVDHFVDFVNRPYFHQDVAYGMRTLKLSSGDTIQMPNIIRTVTRSTMIAQYQQYCKDENYEPLSRSTLYRILDVREASQRQSFQGLDNTAADGSTGFQTMKTIIEQLVQAGVDKVWAQVMAKRLDKGKQYLKTEFKVNCTNMSSLCADHCRQYALSDSSDKDFQVECDHQHSILCENCEDLKNSIAEVQDKVQQHQHSTFNQELKEDLLYDFKEAQKNIFKWKAHIIRSINQEQAKQQILEDMNESSVLIVMDWAMKFVQRRFREKQSDWYGKRGLSWHVSSVVSKDTEKNTFDVTSYVHLFNTCTQDWFAVISIVENLLKNIKNISPHVRKAYIRSDEAGCYHNNLLIAAIKDVGDRVGVSVEGYDFSEPQQGKDICDRIICPLKASVRTFCNEGNDILTATDMHKALLHHPVRGTTCSVNEVSVTVPYLEVHKLSNFSSYHNFVYTKGGIRVWKAYGIGNGKIIPDQSFYVNHQEATRLEVVAEFTPLGTQRRQSKVHKNGEDTDAEETQSLFDCPETGCNFVFSSFNELELHMDLGQHSRFVNNETVYDTLKREWAHQFSTITSSTFTGTGSSTSMGQTQLEMGWALSKPRTGNVRFSENVRKYLISKFDYGERTGNKLDAEHVAMDMRVSKDENGERRFSRDEWLNKTQIKGFFSRLTKVRRKEGNACFDRELEMDLDSEDIDDTEEEDSRKDLIERIVDGMNVQHPIYYDTFDLCELHQLKQLSVFKVTMLKEICSHFELQFKSKDRKDTLISKISQMVKNCTCIKK